MNKLFLLFISFIYFNAEAADGAIKSPNISANTLLLYQNSNYHKEDKNLIAPDQNPNGFNVQETELQFYSDVDPYSRLNLVLAIHPEYESDGTTIEQTWAIEPEELFVEITSLPWTTIKAGKFKAYVGKQNMLHSHAFPFVQTSLSNQSLLGDEGLNDTGLSAAILFPSTWYNELTLQALRGEGENSQFSSSTYGDNVGIAHWKNLIDLSESLTMELGASYASGANSVKGNTAYNGADLTFKWRPNQGGRYQSLLFSSEYLARLQTQPGGVDSESGKGFTTFLQYQFAERWSVLCRYDNLIIANTFAPTELPAGTSDRNSIALIYMPSEFSSFKFEYNQRHGGAIGPKGEITERTFFLQTSFTIGSHPAHSY